MTKLPEMISALRAYVMAYIRQTPEWGLNAIVRRCLLVARLALLYPVSTIRLVLALTAPKLFPTVRKFPILLLKFTWPVYATGLSTSDRAAFIANHYLQLGRRYSQKFIEEIYRIRPLIWQASMESREFGISLNGAPTGYGEGEMSITLTADGADVYVLSFIFVPAKYFGIDGDQAVFITRLQGARGFGEEIKRTTLLFGGVSPALVLMAALQGIAQASGFRHVVGICAKEQACMRGDAFYSDLVSAYDEYWSALGGRRIESGHYYFPVPFLEKPYALIKRNHRQRVRRRRAFRRSVADSVRAEVQNYCEH